MKHLIALLGMLLAIGLDLSCFAQPPTIAGHQSRLIDGWTVHISESLLDEESEATAQALELLSAQLQEIARVVPLEAVAELRKVPLWFSQVYPGIQPSAEYHPGADWLRANHRDPAMEKAVEFTNVLIFERETKRMPNFALHELAHAYHDRVLENGFGNAEIVAAFANAKAKGLYANVEQRFGDGRSATGLAYAMTSPMEYFAECSEAFFVTNDFFPFNREELKRHDPTMFALLETLWSSAGNDSSEPKAIADYQAWKHSGSLWLITTAEGANLPSESTIESFPTLVRLNRDFFDFAQAQPNGDDLRLTTTTGVPLAYQIEEWDAEQGMASVWVRIPEIQGNTTQELRVYWGNPNVQSESNGAAVFNASNGYLSVWHMNEPVHDTVGTLKCTDHNTTNTTGMVGSARNLSDGSGVSGGDSITNYPTGASPHTTEAWFRPERPNTTLIAWGNEEAQGKVVMQFRSPPHVRMDCYFSDGSVNGNGLLAIGEWSHVVHTYQQGESKIYVNGKLDVTNHGQGSPLKIRSPAKLWIGGWYNHYDFVGDLDEVRVSNVVRSADWVRLQFENQKPNQTLVGPIVGLGDAFSVSQKSIAIAEGQSTTVTAQAGGAQKVYWILNRKGKESIVATDRFSYTFDAGRVAATSTRSDLAPKLIFKAIYADGVKFQEIPIAIRDDIPEPEFVLSAPKQWDGRKSIEVAIQVNNLAAMQAKGKDDLNVDWMIDGVAVIKESLSGKLSLKRAQGNGVLNVTALVDNGGEKSVQSASILVQQPDPSSDDWVMRPIEASEQPEDHQFIAREGTGQDGFRQGTLTYAGKLDEPAESVFVRLYTGDTLISTQSVKPNADQTYRLPVALKAELVKYRTEFGTKTGEKEQVLHTASNIVCGDVFVIIGQSNAVATDFGKDNPLTPSDWVRTFGSTDTGPEGSRITRWSNAEARSPDGLAAIGYWGMELGRQLSEQNQIPICILNGAVGGTRIDQHQRNPNDPTDASTIYGRLLWRLQKAKLTHGVRAIIWHQGENDQGADGPTGGYGYETYRQYFFDLAANWKEDYPNIERYYVFQIWPKACAMGINGSDNRLREVQRTLPRYFSNLSVMSTLGIKPPGGCHFPAAGYAEFARLLLPMINHQVYHRVVGHSFDSPNLKRASFTNAERNELLLEFDGPHVAWSEALATQFNLDDQPGQVVSGAVNANQIRLKLKEGSKAKTVTYLNSDSWKPDHLLYGVNGIAALTFCDVPIEPAP